MSREVGSPSARRPSSVEHENVLSLSIQRALEREVVGQPRAVQALIRAVTIAHSDLRGREAPAGMFLFLGPSGTGKTHIARSLARVLHGDTERLAVVDCVQLEQQDDWQELVRQIAPYFRYPVPGYGEQLRAMAPLSVLLVEHLEAVRSEFAQALVAAFETGRLALPDDAAGSLRGCLVLLTSRLCGREIFGEDRQEIGFSPASGDLEEGERARLYDSCCESVELAWGTDFLGHLDDLIIFHRLQERHLPQILDRYVTELNRRLAEQRVRIELEPTATQYLLERGARFLQYGAWYLGKVFRRFVLFPTADLASSDRLRPGSHISVRLVDEKLRLDVDADDAGAQQVERPDGTGFDIPIVWDEPTVTSPF
jgi:ATP-dependent Clp protease ATP-binding subunit ClpC